MSDRADRVRRLREARKAAEAAKPVQPAPRPPAAAPVAEPLRGRVAQPIAAAPAARRAVDEADDRTIAVEGLAGRLPPADAPSGGLPQEVIDKALHAGQTPAAPVASAQFHAPSRPPAPVPPAEAPAPSSPSGEVIEVGPEDMVSSSTGRVPAAVVASAQAAQGQPPSLPLQYLDGRLADTQTQAAFRELKTGRVPTAVARAVEVAPQVAPVPVPPQLIPPAVKETRCMLKSDGVKKTLNFGSNFSYDVILVSRRGGVADLLISGGWLDTPIELHLQENQPMPIPLRSPEGPVNLTIINHGSEGVELHAAGGRTRGSKIKEAFGRFVSHVRYYLPEVAVAALGTGVPLVVGATLQGVWQSTVATILVIATPLVSTGWALWSGREKHQQRVQAISESPSHITR